MDLDSTKQQLRKGLLEYALLLMLSQKEAYVGDMMRGLAATEFATQEGTLYPLLSRLRRESHISHRWVESAGGPPRKYYSLTESGEAHLAALKDYWKELDETLSALGGAL